MKKIIFRVWLKGICLRNKFDNMYNIWKLNRNIDKLVKETRKSISK